MIIRTVDLTDEHDLFDVIEGAGTFLEQSGVMGGVAIDKASLESTMLDLLGIPTVTVIAAEVSGELVGGIGLSCGPWMWNKNVLFCEELFWWVRDDAPNKTAHKLFNSAMEFIEEARDGEVARISFTCLESSPGGVARLYERWGMERTGTFYMMTEGYH